MSSVDGTDEMGEVKRRRELLAAPIEVRVERLVELARCVDDADSTEEVKDNCREEMWVVGATIAVDMLGAVLRIADALDTLAAHARAREAGSGGVGSEYQPFKPYGGAG